MSEKEEDRNKAAVKEEESEISDTSDEEAVESEDEEINPQDTADGLAETVKGAIKTLKNLTLSKGELEAWIAKNKFYNMKHEKRGIALIFNHYEFNDESLSKRDGTNKDVGRLVKAFKKHKFQVEVFHELTVADIFFVIERVHTMADQSKCDCLAVAILTHGKEGGKLYAKDGTYNLNDLIEKTSAANCKLLAGKPKLFFVQACRGNRKDLGQTIAVDSVPPRTLKVKIPTFPDFFIVQSTMDGYVSIRNTVKGSWFVKALSKKLLEEESHTKSIFSLMTEVVAYVAFKCESNPDKWKQIPNFTSTLTRDLIFEKK